MLVTELKSSPLGSHSLPLSLSFTGPGTQPGLDEGRGTLGTRATLWGGSIAQAVMGGREHGCWEDRIKGPGSL